MLRSGTRSRRLFSARGRRGHDDIRADDLVRRAGSVVASSQRGAVLNRSETHQGVVDRAAGYPQLAEYRWQSPGCPSLDEERSGEPVVDQASRIRRGEPKIPGETREHRVRFGHCVPAEGDLATAPPRNDLRVGNVGSHQQRDRNARIKSKPVQRRPLSISLKTSSSLIVVSPVATSTPSSSTRRATLPAGLIWRPDP